jgi:ABC-type uncharacterized transport system substrate-binding protein
VSASPGRRPGLADSLERPGGNVTGTTIFAPQLIAKRLRCWLSSSPARRARRCCSTGERHNPPQLENLRTTAEAFGVDVLGLDVRSTDDLDAAFAAARSWGAEGLRNGVDSLINSMRARIAELAARYAVPAVYTDREYVQEGGLMLSGLGISTAIGMRRGTPICPFSSQPHSSWWQAREPFADLGWPSLPHWLRWPPNGSSDCTLRGGPPLLVLSVKGGTS